MCFLLEFPSVIYFNTAMFFHICVYYYFEQINVGWKVIEAVLKLYGSFGVRRVIVKERKMSASAFLMVEVD